LQKIAREKNPNGKQKKEETTEKSDVRKQKIGVKKSSGKVLEEEKNGSGLTQKYGRRIMPRKADPLRKGSCQK